MLQKRGLD